MHRTATSTTVAFALMLAPAFASSASAAPAVLAPNAVAQTDQSLGSTLTPGQQLTEGQFLQSPNGRFHLTLEDGALLVTKLPNRLTPETYRQGQFFDEGGTRLVLQPDGDLVFFDGDRVVDRTGSGGSEATGLSMQDDGNVVLYREGGIVVASANTLAVNLLRAGGTLLPGELLRLDDGPTVLGMQGDGNLVLRRNGQAVFNTGTQGNPGAAAIQQGDGNFVVYATNGTPLFDTGSSNDLGDFTAAVVGPSDFRVVMSAGEGVQSLYGTSWDDPAVLPGQDLSPGDRRVAPGALLILQTDGNLVQYQNGRAVFVRNDVFDAEMRTDGNFVARRFTGGGLATAFTTRSGGNPGSRLVVQSDGNLVVYTPDNAPVYSRK